MKKILTVTALALATFSQSSHAVPIAGFSDVIDNGGGSFTFLFDTLGGPDITNADGLTFTNGSGLELTVTSGTGIGIVWQDVPANGGLGLGPDGANGTCPGTHTDNLECGESLIFTFNQSVNLAGFTLNGLLNSDGHSDAASGSFMAGDGALTTAFTSDAGAFDGVGADFGSPLSYLYPAFSGMTSFSITAGTADNAQSWHGYVESLTIQMASVPEPSILALMGIGLAGLGFARRGHRS